MRRLGRRSLAGSSFSALTNSRTLTLSSLCFSTKSPSWDEVRCLCRWSRLKIDRSHRRYTLMLRKQEFFSSVPGTDLNKRPYITVTMKLGIQEEPPSFKEGPSSFKARIRVGMSGSRGANTRSMVKAMTEGRHPQYAISITGCAPSVHQVIGEQEINTYARLLASITGQ